MLRSSAGYSRLVGKGLIRREVVGIELGNVVPLLLLIE
jgi:hypothetical protein